MINLKKALLICICFFAWILPAWANDTQSITLILDIPQINWIKIKDPGLSINSIIGFPTEGDEFSYKVTATGIRPRVITARLGSPLSRGCRIILEMAPLGVGESTGPVVLSPQEKVVLKNIWGIFDRKGIGKITMETDMDALERTGGIEIIFTVKEGI